MSSCSDAMGCDDVRAAFNIIKRKQVTVGVAVSPFGGRSNGQRWRICFDNYGAMVNKTNITVIINNGKACLLQRANHNL